jgi:hypothetical protein
MIIIITGHARTACTVPSHRGSVNIMGDAKNKENLKIRINMLYKLVSRVCFSLYISYQYKNVYKMLYIGYIGVSSSSFFLIIIVYILHLMTYT